jgi:hypothetical protein
VEEAFCRNTQIVVVTNFLADVRRPTLFVRSDEFKYPLIIRLHVTVNATEMIPMIFHTAVLFASTREVEARPSLDLFRLANLLQPVWQN